MFNEDDLHKWKSSKPFNHLVIDNFLESSLAMQIADEFPSINNKG